MRLYINTERQWSGTQADAKAMGERYEQIDVPVDKAGLIDFLNGKTFMPRPSTAIFQPAVEPTHIPCAIAMIDEQTKQREDKRSPLDVLVKQCSMVELKELSTTLQQLLHKTWNVMDKEDVA